MEVVTLSNFKSPWALAKTTARSPSLRPLQLRRIQPLTLASSGKHFLAHLSNTSGARADHWRRLSPSFPWKAKTSAMVSHISSCRSCSGHRWSNSLNKTSSPPSIWYSSGLRCSTVSNARPCRSVQMKEPRDDFSSLSMVRILLMAQTFHLLYSLQSALSPEKYFNDEPGSMAVNRGYSLT